MQHHTMNRISSESTFTLPTLHKLHKKKSILMNRVRRTEVKFVESNRTWTHKRHKEVFHFNFISNMFFDELLHTAIQYCAESFLKHF